MILTGMPWGRVATSTDIYRLEYVSTSLRGDTQESQYILTMFYQNLMNLRGGLRVVGISTRLAVKIN